MNNVRIAKSEYIKRVRSGDLQQKIQSSYYNGVMRYLQDLKTKSGIDTVADEFYKSLVKAEDTWYFVNVVNDNLVCLEVNDDNLEKLSITFYEMYGNQRISELLADVDICNVRCKVKI